MCVYGNFYWLGGVAFKTDVTHVEVSYYLLVLPPPGHSLSGIFIFLF